MTSVPIWKMSVPLLFLPLPFSIPLTFYRSSYCECDMNLRISRGFHNKSFFIFHSCMPRKPSIYALFILSKAGTDRATCIHILPAFLFRVFHSLFFIFPDADIYFTTHFKHALSSFFSHFIFWRFHTNGWYLYFFFLYFLQRI